MEQGIAHFFGWCACQWREAVPALLVATLDDCLALPYARHNSTTCRCQRIEGKHELGRPGRGHLSGQVSRMRRRRTEEE